jgi:hypothetical protein
MVVGAGADLAVVATKPVPTTIVTEEMLTQHGKRPRLVMFSKDELKLHGTITIRGNGARSQRLGWM